ncbi:MAG: DNA polymerase III subunit gamma/tau [Planctomycetota bacterium]|nr:DNA polymerase III subunit gamma/tau [Planctomycetota bacterium]MDA0933341.1 DNA polymerase III subunit gamma/tau [Planctomycetota bacterium]
MDRPAEPYQVVARRFRPRRFTELVGQDGVVASLRSALQSGRIPHAFLFSGSRGVGKTTSARILARALNCETGPSADPCGSCDACRSILAGTHPDVVEIDAASHNLVDDIRELRDRVGFASMGGRFKVYILDEVHMLTRSAFNAFLKTLEEPPKNVVFVLATTELHKVPETIRSRCQVLLFRRVDEQDVVSRLRAIVEAEGLSLGDPILEEIAASCRGGMRDAETALERILPVVRDTEGEFDIDTYRRLVHRVGLDRAVEVAEELLSGNAAPALHFAEDVVGNGVDEREALGELLEVFRAVLLLKVDGQDSTLVAFHGALRERLQLLAQHAEATRLDAIIQAGLLGRERIRRLDDRRLVLEVTLLRMAEAGALPTLADLVQAVEAGGVPLPSPSSVPAGRAAAAPAAGGAIRGALVAEIKKRKPMLQGTVEECAFAGPDDDGVVRVALRTERKMHRDRLESPQVQQLLREALEAVCGRPIRVEITPAAGRARPVPQARGSEAPPPEPRASRAAEAPAPTEGVRRILDRFQGQVLEPDEPD